ncbi:hypothetical protein QE152_g13307 [Popillia japonica]|uniref:Follicle cell protein 3C-1 n=1 Tax=Popillia japonica TaxID=7064 RepID=A0AAW1LBL7_POPJA
MCSKSLLAVIVLISLISKIDAADESNDIPVPCTCGIFLSGQFEKGSKEQPKGLPALTQEVGGTFPKTPLGIKQCTNKCLDAIIKHLPKSGDIICSTMDRDCYKERAYLFVQNHSPKWIQRKSLFVRAKS